MKHLKLWENFEHSDLNSKYIELAHILQSEVFDEFDVKSKTDEQFQDNDVDFHEPLTHKFWAFRVKDNKFGKTIANLQEIEDNHLKIEYINAFGIPEVEKDKFLEKIESISGLVEDFLGLQLVTSDEYWSQGLYDIIIDVSGKGNKKDDNYF
jgi:hypothetical protein